MIDQKQPVMKPLFTIPREEMGKHGEKLPDMEFLPPYISQENFKSDLHECFTPKSHLKQHFPSEFSKLSDQVKEPIDFEEIESSDLTLTEKTEAKIVHKFFQEFRKSHLYKDIMEANDYDPDACAELTAALLEARSFDAKGRQRTLSSILHETLLDANNSRMSSFMSEFGKGPRGSHDKLVELLERADKIAKILPTLRMKYRSAAKVQDNKIESVYPEDDIEPRNIKTLSEMPLISELMLEDDIYYQKVATKELQTAQHYRNEHTAKKYGMLIDVSGSMEHYQMIEYACASAISLVENALEGMNEVTIFLFDQGVKDMRKFTSADAIKQYMLKTPFTGGGTNINRVLEEADSKKYDELILITDGEDRVSYVPDTNLYTVFCNPHHCNNELQDISHSFEWLKGSGDW